MRAAGYKHTQETKDKISAANKGRVRSEETKRKISKAKKGIATLPAGFHHSQRTKDKISASKKGKTNGPPSEATRQKISKANSGRATRPADYRPSHETRGRMSLAAAGRTVSRKTKEKISRIVRAHHLALPIAERRKWREKMTPILQSLAQVKTPTYIERLAMDTLDSLGVPYTFQYPIGHCSIDLFIFPRYCIEIDGTYWHTRPDKVAKDRRRTYWLKSKGYIVIRVPESDLRADAMAAMQYAISLCTDIAKIP